MTDLPLDIAVVTDEISRTLPEALDYARSWGLTRFELREGSERRFPDFTAEEIAAVESVLRDGCQVTAVSPGILKGAADDEAAITEALEVTLPRTITLAARFDCPLVIVFGFERYAGEPEENRTRAMRAFERAADQAAEAGMRIVIENEPNFWIDDPASASAMLDEIGHPALALNWDPANQHWGGHLPTRADFDAVLPYLANLHVKDFAPNSSPDAPWVPVGEGETPWAQIFPWVVAESNLSHVTLETHCVPLVESSRRSLDGMRRLLNEAAHAV